MYIFLFITAGSLMSSALFCQGIGIHEHPLQFMSFNGTHYLIVLIALNCVHYMNKFIKYLINNTQYKYN